MNKQGHLSAFRQLYSKAKLVQIVGVILPVLMLGGCATSIDAFYNRDVVEDTVGDQAATLTIPANRRVVIVSLAEQRKGFICAEAPPDVAMQIDSSLKLALKADRDSGDAKTASIDASLEDALNRLPHELNNRPMSLEFLRTSAFSLCQLHMNGAMSGQETASEFSRILDRATDLMAREIAKKGNSQ